MTAREAEGTGMSGDATTEIESDALRVTVSDRGAEMQRLQTRDGRDWLWHGDGAWWTGRAPILFPIIGQAPDDRIGMDGQTFPIEKHGIARRRLFRRIAATTDSVTHELTDSAETRTAFPRAFRLRLTHRVEGATLTCRAEVHNSDDRPSCFSIGFHPAFLWPLPGAEGRAHHVTLDNAAEPALARLKDGLVRADRLPSPFTRGHLTLDPALFEEDAMIFPEGVGDGLTFAADGGPALRFAFENTPQLGIWQKPGAPFLCIEPWHGMAARQGDGPEMDKRPGAITLPAGADMAIAYSVTVAA